MSMRQRHKDTDRHPQGLEKKRATFCFTFKEYSKVNQQIKVSKPQIQVLGQSRPQPANHIDPQRDPFQFCILDRLIRGDKY